jgi:hypothetical protein
MLYLVLKVPLSASKPVQLLHLSFQDFLINPKKANQEEQYPFSINKQEIHGKLVWGYLKLMLKKKPLRRDIYGLKHPGIERYNINQRIINSRLPPKIKYIYRYWVFHQKESSLKINNNNIIHTFLQKYFLH